MTLDGRSEESRAAKARPAGAALFAAGSAMVAFASLLAAVFGCARAEEPKLRVFAAASLGEALGEVAASYTAASGEEVELNFAGSAVLARQIEAGAAADVFVSADRALVDRLAADGRAEPETAVDLLSTRLVVVVPNASPVEGLADAAGLLRFDRLAIADPFAAPAGVYARRWLEATGLWGDLEARLVPSADVRAALAAVAGGHLAAGIVYATDAAGEPRVRVVYAPGDSPEVRYVAVALAGARPSARFLRHLAGVEAGRVFRRHGFELVDALAARHI